MFESVAFKSVDPTYVERHGMIRARRSRSRSRFPEVRAVRIERNGSSASTLMTVTRPTTTRKKMMMVYAHGSGHDLGALHAAQERLGGKSLVQMLADCSRCAVVAFEYPGYGSLSSSSSWSTTGAVDAMVAAYEYAAAGATSVVMYGYSIGSGIAVEACKRICNDRRHPRGGRLCLRPSALILEASFESLLSRTPIGPLEHLMRLMRLVGVDAFPTAAVVGRLPVPVHYAHGTADERCPIEDVRRMAAGNANTRSVLWADGKGHDGAVVDARFCPFLKKACCARA